MTSGNAARPLTVVIVTFNAEGDIRDCVSSFAGAPDCRVIVVDNNSTDSTRAVLTDLEAEGLVTELILNPENVGFAKAVNAGLGRAGTDDVLLFNPDARIDAANLAEFRTLSDDPAIGILGPKLDSGPHVSVLSAGQQPSLRTSFTHFSGLSRIFPNTKIFRGRHLFSFSRVAPLEDVGWVSGACLLLTYRARQGIGALSERWFMYGEDLDLCRRVTEFGLRVVYVPGVHAGHAMGKSVNATGGAVSRMWVNNTLDYYIQTKSPNGFQIFLWKLMFSGGMGARAAVFSARSAVSRTDRDELAVRANRLWNYSNQVWHYRGPM